MAESVTIARPYAEALFKAALETQTVALYADLMTGLAEFTAYDEITAVIKAPNISDKEKNALILAAIDSSVPEEIKNFIELLIKNRRLNLLPDIAAQFHELKNAAEKAADVEIVSAFPLSEPQIKALAAVLEEKFNCILHPSVRVDSTLIGGIKVIVGDQVLDMSIKEKLHQMQNVLTA